MEHIQTAAADQLLYKITHDLSATVRALVELPIWISEDLKDSGVVVSDDIQENLDALTVNGKRLAAMIESLVTYSQIGKKQTLGTIDLADMVVTILNAEPLPQAVIFTTEFTEPSILFHEPDFTRLCHALISNAIKHRDAETRHIWLNITAENTWIEVVVQDDGPGIPPDFREKALKVLSSLKSRDDVEGSGMGLAVADKIASHYGGKLTLETPVSGAKRGLLVRAKIPKPSVKTEMTPKDSASP